MQILYDFFPIAIFFIAYAIAGIYYATGAAIITSVIQVGLYRWRHKKFEKMQVITLIIIAVMGTATIILHKAIFIQWKPTIVNWIFALAFLGSHYFGKKNILRLMLDKKITLPDIVWKRLNLGWIVFFAVMGGVNLLVVYNFSIKTWVYFKFFGFLGLTVVFVILQSIYLAKYMTEADVKR